MGGHCAERICTTYANAIYTKWVNYPSSAGQLYPCCNIWLYKRQRKCCQSLLACGTTCPDTFLPKDFIVRLCGPSCEFVMYYITQDCIRFPKYVSLLNFVVYTVQGASNRIHSQRTQVCHNESTNTYIQAHTQQTQHLFTTSRKLPNISPGPSISCSHTVAASFSWSGQQCISCWCTCPQSSIPCQAPHARPSSPQV